MIKTIAPVLVGSKLVQVSSYNDTTFCVVVFDIVSDNCVVKFFHSLQDTYRYIDNSL